ncbi:MAG TPA: SDR family NAD(P)-dependent oxidoreductase [Treponema sp.]|nr:SDR family NAD(P)-dependent oxidoreductase [Treponema sp.]
MKVCISGANRGLGLALTSVFLEQGHQVFALYRHKGKEFIELEQKWASPDSASQLIPLACDVADEIQIRQLKQEIESKTKGLDMLINNAAVHLEQQRPDLRALDFSIYGPTLTINAVAPLMLVQHLISLLRKGAGKTIIAISSEAGSIGSCWRDREYSYRMSKAALNMGFRILHNRLAPEGFKLRLIHPGWVQTDMGGTNAHLTPRASAEAVYKRSMETYQASSISPEQLYIDWEGQTLLW